MRLIDADEYIEKLRDRIGIEPSWNHSGLRIAIFELHNMPTIDAVEVVRCNQCKHYKGVHNVPGCAPCAFWGIGAVMWDDFCKRGERYDTD